MSLTVTVDLHPTDPAARIIAKADSDADLQQLDLLFQGLLSRANKEGNYADSNTIIVYFQTVEPPLPKYPEKEDS